MTLKSPGEVAAIREAGRVVALVLDELDRIAVPGLPLSALDEIAASLLRKHGARSSFLGYRGYPNVLCASVNDVVVHGIPGDRELDDGDIVGLDFGAVVDGFHADAARTIQIGGVSGERARLVEATREALQAGIDALRGENPRVGDIGAAVSARAAISGFAVIERYGGHGVGRGLHEEPFIPNTGTRGRGRRLRPGTVIAIEPLLASGGGRVLTSSDGWSVRTVDGSDSAHFEHTVVVTEVGPIVLTVP